MVYILLGTGFEEMEAVAPGDILRRGGVEVCYLGVGAQVIRGSHGISLTADSKLCPKMPISSGDLFVIPGGLGGVDSIENSTDAMQLLSRARDEGASLAAICAGPRVLAKLGVLTGRKITCYPGCESWMTGAQVDCSRSVCSDGILTGRAPGSAMDFGLALLEQLRGKKAAEDVRAALVYER